MKLKLTITGYEVFDLSDLSQKIRHFNIFLRAHPEFFIWGP